MLGFAPLAAFPLADDADHKDVGPVSLRRWARPGASQVAVTGLSGQTFATGPNGRTFATKD